MREFAARGGRVVVDLGGMQHSLIEDSPFFLGVTAVEQTTKAGVEVRVHSAEPGVPALPASLRLPGEPKPGYPKLTDWRYVGYLGLDRSLADDANAPERSVLGYKDLKGGGRAWFVGGGLFYHAFLTGDARELSVIRALAEAPPRTSAEATGALTEDPAAGSDAVAFASDAPVERTVLVSEAFSRHWKATIDGKAVPTYNVDDLIAVMVPPGRHEVRVEYGALPLHWAAGAVSIATLGMLGYAYSRDRRRSKGPQRSTPLPTETEQAA